MMKHSIILIAVLTAAALVAMVATRQLAVKQEASRTEAQPGDLGIEVSVVRAPDGAVLEIALVPKDEDVAVSTFALELTITDKDGDRVETTGAIRPDEIFTSESWSFPLLQTVPEGEKLVVKISGVHVATAPYELEDRQVIATVPISSSVETDDLLVTAGTEHTKFLTKDATPIPVDENVVVR